MKVLVIDNEPLIRKGLINIIELTISNITEIHEAQGVVSGLDAIKKHNPDIVLLDIELDDGTGIELLQQLEEINFSLIFITAHNKYAIDAFRFSAIDFLLKPTAPEALFTAFQKAMDQLNNRLLKEQLQVLKNSLDKINFTDKRIVLKDINSIYFININDIIRCQSHGQYTEFHCTSQKIVISKSLKEYQDILSPFGFIRPHHSHLINTSKILRFDKVNGGNIIMDNLEEVPVSHRKKSFVLKALDKL